LEYTTASVPIPFSRPLPPPSLPLLGYEDDDGEYTDDEDGEGTQGLEYMHTDMLWCTPISCRLMLIPTDNDENHDSDNINQELYQEILTILQNHAFGKPLLPNERRIVIDYLSSKNGSNIAPSSTSVSAAAKSAKAIEQSLQLLQECGLTPQTLPQLVEHNPLIAHECLLLILQYMPDDKMKNEYLSSLVGMDMSLHSMEVMNRLAMYNHNMISTSSTKSSSSHTDHGEHNNAGEDVLAKKPLLHPEYIHLFIGSCIASCENMQPDRNVQNRLVRLVCVFIQSLLRNCIVTPEDIYFEVQSFCVEFSRIREASTLYKSLQQSTSSKALMPL
jgi:CCR4-NOT transcription complex subunit 11